MLQRFRVWLALRLVRRTDCVVVRAAPIREAVTMAGDLHQYVQRSGALQDPRRVKAWRRIVRLTTVLVGRAEQAVI